LAIFKIGSHELCAGGWLWTNILLISASWVARIIGVSHQQLALLSFWRPPRLLKAVVPLFFFFSLFLVLICFILFLPKKHLTFCLRSRSNSLHLLSVRPGAHISLGASPGETADLFALVSQHVPLGSSWHFTRAPHEATLPQLCLLHSAFCLAQQRFIYFTPTCAICCTEEWEG
jgi:hypothetical protein